MGKKRRHEEGEEHDAKRVRFGEEEEADVNVNGIERNEQRCNGEYSNGHCGSSAVLAGTGTAEYTIYLIRKPTEFSLNSVDTLRLRGKPKAKKSSKTIADERCEVEISTMQSEMYHIPLENIMRADHSGNIRTAGRVEGLVSISKKELGFQEMSQDFAIDDDVGESKATPPTIRSIRRKPQMPEGMQQRLKAFGLPKDRRKKNRSSKKHKRSLDEVS